LEQQAQSILGWHGDEYAFYREHDLVDLDEFGQGEDNLSGGQQSLDAIVSTGKTGRS
jgi:hypothetical protein